MREGWVWIGTAWAIAAAIGCASSGPATGAEGGACYPNDTCDDRLVCLSDLCVDLGDLPDAGRPDADPPTIDATSAAPDASPTTPDAAVPAPDASPSPDAAPTACNPVSQTGCASGQKCAYILDDPGTGAQHVGCAPDGTAAVGDACTEPTVAGGTDSCAAGGDCYRGTCREICTTVSDMCTDGSCVTFGDGMGGIAPIEICLPDCDPLLQDCAGAGEGCYLTSGGTVCVGAGTAGPGEPCAAVNQCAAGLICIGSSMGGFFCRTMCGPWMDCWDAMDNPTSCGCGATVACAADEICFAIGDGMGGAAHDTAGVCIADSDTGGSCDCSATPICM